MLIHLPTMTKDSSLKHSKNKSIPRRRLVGEDNEIAMTYWITHHLCFDTNEEDLLSHSMSNESMAFFEEEENCKERFKSSLTFVYKWMTDD